MVAVKGGDEALARDLAMHVAALNPAYIDAGGVPAAVLDKEREILAEQTKAEKKPPEIIAKMVQGRLPQVSGGDHPDRPAVRQGPRHHGREAAQKKPAPPSCNSCATKWAPASRRNRAIS